MGRAALDCLRKRGERILHVQRVQRGAAHFVILSGEKRRMLKMAYLKQEN